jgi:hypothetical protein
MAVHGRVRKRCGDWAESWTMPHLTKMVAEPPPPRAPASSQDTACVAHQRDERHHTPRLRCLWCCNSLPGAIALSRIVVGGSSAHDTRFCLTVHCNPRDNYSSAYCRAVRPTSHSLRQHLQRQIRRLDSDRILPLTIVSLAFHNSRCFLLYHTDHPVVCFACKSPVPPSRYLHNSTYTIQTVSATTSGFVLCGSGTPRREYSGATKASKSQVQLTKLYIH